MESILGIDPGSFESGYCLIKDGEPDAEFPTEVVEFGIMPNNELLSYIPALECRPVVAIETPRPMGIPTAGQVMETLIYIGELVAMSKRFCLPYTYVFRGDVKIFICGRANVKDTNVNQALRDRFGGDDRQKLIKCPDCKGKGWLGRGRPTCQKCGGNGIERQAGPLFKMTSHAYPALAVALWRDSHLIDCKTILNPVNKKRTPQEQSGTPLPTASSLS